MPRATSWAPLSLLSAILTALAVVGTCLASARPTHAADTPPPPDDSRFQKVLLANHTDLTQPMRMKIADDGRVIFIERDGRVKVWDPSTKDVTVAGTVPVAVTGELGLVGLALAPDFESTGHLYLHFSLTDYRTSYQARVSRFTLSKDNHLDPSSEVPIIDIQHPQGWGGGHSAGDLLMTPDGKLFIATGDNTDCCASLGFPPTDERPGHASGDAQRTAANTNDLNGKILRIVPKSNGGYDIPDGNLFPPGTPKTRPEIYAMGLRNPFTLGDYDPKTGTLWMADYGPDAVQPDPDRGPAGHVRVILMTKPGFYGWPYCTMNNVPYNDWNYAENKPGPWFDCDNPVNDSPNNTGQVDLPPAQPATIYYTYQKQEDFPQLYGGGAMAGPMYRYDPDNPSTTKFPEWFDGRRFFYDWTTNWIQTTEFSDDLKTATGMQELLPDMDFSKPMDMDFGPDGSLYVLEYGNGWGTSNDDSGLYRIDYVDGNRTPAVNATASADSGALPLTVNFDASESTDPDGDAMNFAWDFDGDGSPDATGAKTSHTYTTAGQFHPRVTVTDANGASAVDNLTVTAGNTRPKVSIELPTDGSFAEFGDKLPFKIKVTDPEDGTVDCTKVQVQYLLGHNEHAHPMATATPDANCQGVLVPGSDASHGSNAYVYHVVQVTYADHGGAGDTPALTGEASVVLHPRRYLASTYQRGDGVGLYSGQLFVPGSGNWFMYPRINLRNIDQLEMELATREPGADVTVHADSPTGPVVAKFDAVPDTGSTSLNDRVYKWFTAPVSDPGGAHDLYFVGDWAEGVTPQLFVRNFQFQTVPSVTATLDPASPSGAHGWYTSNVALTLDDKNAPLWTMQYRDGDGAWTNYAQPVTFTEGRHQVSYHAMDAAGSTTPEGTLSVNVDGTAPVLNVEGVSEGEEYGDAGALTPTFSSTDSVSGVSTLTATLDGTAVTSNDVIALSSLPLGSHQLTVTATDEAGNIASRHVTFSTHTSIEDMSALIDRFQDGGQVTDQGARVLHTQLDVAQRDVDNGRSAQARDALDRFQRFANSPDNVPDTRARDVLLRDARAMVASLGDATGS